MIGNKYILNTLTQSSEIINNKYIKNINTLTIKSTNHINHLVILIKFKRVVYSHTQVTQDYFAVRISKILSILDSKESTRCSKVSGDFVVSFALFLDPLGLPRPFLGASSTATTFG